MHEKPFLDSATKSANDQRNPVFAKSGTRPKILLTVYRYDLHYIIDSTTMHDLSSSKTKQGDHVEATITGCSPKVLDDKGPVEVSDPQLIFSVSKGGATEATHNSHLRDCPSVESTTSLDSSVTSDGEVTNRNGGSIMSVRSPGGTVKRVSFCPSPPQVREYERHDTERKKPSSARKGTPVQFNNLNKKCRMLKKNLDKLNGDDVKAAAPVQGKRSVTRIAKRLGQAFLTVSASALSSPGARTSKIKNWLAATPIAKLPASDTRPATSRWTHRRRRQTSKN
jgi:hypothetical protein